MINNCLFNLCMVDPIHMEDQEYDELYDRLCGLFTDTENCLQGALDRLDAMLSAPGCQAPEMHYTAPLETELQIKTPLGLRYARILETLDRLLMKIDQALTAGIISNPRDAVKLKFQWTRKVFAFTGEIRSLDNRR